jgi:hypothetical protein
VLPTLLVGLLMALMFYIPNQAQIRVDTGVRGLNVANLLFILSLGVLLLSHQSPSERAPLKRPLLLFFVTLSWALFIALWGDSTAWVEDVTLYKNAVFYPLLFFLYFHAVRDLRTVRKLLLLLLLIMLMSGILGLRQALDYGIATFNENKRVSAPFGWGVYDANRAAIFFCIYLQPIGAAALFLRSRGWLRLACAGVFLLGVFVIFHTYSRQAYGILAVTTLLIALRRHLVLAALAALALYNYQMWAPETVVERIEMTTVDPFDNPVRPYQPSFDPLAALDRPWFADPDLALPGRKPLDEAVDADGTHLDASTESRFTIWAGAWELIQQRPAGIGLNRFKRSITAHVPAELAGKDAHNYYVLVTTEAGVLAPLTVLALLGGLLLLGLRLTRMRDDDEARALGIGFVMATVAVMLGNIYGSRFVDGDVMSSYWILAALVARMALIKERERREAHLPARSGVPAVRASNTGGPTRPQTRAAPTALRRASRGRP